MEPVLQTSEMEERIKSLEAVVENQAVQIAKMEALIKYYEEQFMLAKRRQFGRSSEHSPDQLRIENMFNEAEDQADLSEPEPTFEEIAYKRKKRVGKRKDDLTGLPVERVNYELPESERICPECGELMRDIGVNIRDELKIIPAQIVHVEHAAHSYACGNCENSADHTPIVKAAAPRPLISGSLASPSAVAHIATQKYVNGMPLYRIEKGFTYDGAALSRQTMANWLIYCAQNYLIAIYSLLAAYLLKEDIAHSDDTTVQVLHEPGRSATSKSCEWLYRTGSRSTRHIVIYEYQETRNQEHPRTFLKGFRGFLNCDAYQGYHNLPPYIIVVGCWSHYLGNIIIQDGAPQALQLQRSA
jgi:transposase